MEDDQFGCGVVKNVEIEPQMKHDEFVCGEEIQDEVDLVDLIFFCYSRIVS